MKAPADGVVVQKNIKVGDMVMPGMLTIMIVDTEDLEIDVSVSESLISKVRVEQSVLIEIPSISYRTIVEKFKGCNTQDWQIPGLDHI